MKKNTPTVDDYISTFPGPVQALLNQMRQTIVTQAPGATEGIAYGIPAYKTNKKPLVYFAGFTHHIGFYATPAGHSAFAGELAHFRQGKGSVQFPLDQPLPIDLIARIVAFRVNQNIEASK